ncbi:sirohydrochlorin cobaltochelatase [Veillonella agrestimuris]|uniref:sirohydrochlorin cobaltochelatase n=1 Tax=Veillonella agrestimuris TaxID=2941340 RepID=UPI00203D6E11|nr:sirohydrochlorin cobaltochelatase [Veillonella agrestimuris]
MYSVKKSLALSATLACLFCVGAPTVSDAAFQLSEDVKNPTQALKEASTIGVRSHHTAALQQLENKDAIVVMSFGTTFKETRKKTIDATVKAIQAAHPNTKVVTAFTSHIIRDRIQENEGITYPTPEEALEQLKADGYTRVALTTLNIIPGMEYNYNVGVYNLYKNEFKAMSLGTPLMYWMGQEGQTDEVMETVKALSSQFPNQSKDHAILVMAHGTPDPSNAYYAVIQDRIDAAGLNNVFIYTVEGTPNFEDVLGQLKAKGIKEVTLMPFMMVAGDHATNDMAGDEEDSHKSMLMAEGFKVNTYLRGLGENEQIRQIFVERANEAWDALQK